MSKQSQSPPRGDKPTPTAPPPPPGWRHWLWPVALFAALILFLLLPRFGGVTTVNLSYSTFISDVKAIRSSGGSFAISLQRSDWTQIPTIVRGPDGPQGARAAACEPRSRISWSSFRSRVRPTRWLLMTTEQEQRK